MFIKFRVIENYQSATFSRIKGDYTGTMNDVRSHQNCLVRFFLDNKGTMDEGVEVDSDGALNYRDTTPKLPYVSNIQTWG